MVESKPSLILCVLCLVLGLQTSLAMANAQGLERALVPPAGGQVRFLNETSEDKTPRLEKRLAPPAGIQVRYLKGYLRRNPDAAGFIFWLGKLNFYNGDPFPAEMVRSFILSPEYHSRSVNLEVTQLMSDTLSVCRSSR